MLLLRYKSMMLFLNYIANLGSCSKIWYYAIAYKGCSDHCSCYGTNSLKPYKYDIAHGWCFHQSASATEKLFETLSLVSHIEIHIMRLSSLCHSTLFSFFLKVNLGAKESHNWGLDICPLKKATGWCTGPHRPHYQLHSRAGNSFLFLALPTLRLLPIVLIHRRRK